MSNFLTHQELSNIIGSWHPKGFHGHYRSKTRLEFADIYRQNAKPKPPEKFKIRQRDDAFKHVFSSHDNKQVFLNDSTMFGCGVGKKKIESVNKSKWSPEFLTWCEEAGRDRFKKTMYQNDFCSSSATGSKLLLARKSIDNRPISVYSRAFSHGEPNSLSSIETRLDTYQRFSSKNRAKSCVPDRSTVASCMVWNDRINNNNNNSAKQLDPPVQSQPEPTLNNTE